MSSDNNSQELDNKPASPQNSSNLGPSRQSFKVRQAPKAPPPSSPPPPLTNNLIPSSNGESQHNAEQGNGNGSNGHSTAAVYSGKNGDEVSLGDGVKERLIKGTRPGDRYIRLTKPLTTPGQVWEGIATT